MSWLRSLFTRKAQSVVESSAPAPKGPLTVDHYANTIVFMLETSDTDKDGAVIKPLLRMMLVETNAEFRSEVYQAIRSKSPEHLDTVLKVLEDMRRRV